MRIELYPTFDSVFVDERLKGIFYPLCKIELDDEKQTKLFFVSSNGMWTNEDNSSDKNNSTFTEFSLVEKKYQFSGNIELYNGYEIARETFKILEMEFEKNGEKYLENKTKSEEYINQIKSKKILSEKSKLDLDYYLQTFYEYSINKLDYQTNGVFGRFNNMIKGFAKPDKSPIVYEVDESLEDIKINAEYLLPKNVNISDYEEIGVVIGSEFFTDGNDSVLLYNEKNQTVLSMNCYS